MPAEDQNCVYTLRVHEEVGTRKVRCGRKADYVLTVGGVRMRVCKKHLNVFSKELSKKVLLLDHSVSWEPLDYDKREPGGVVKPDA